MQKKAQLVKSATDDSLIKSIKKITCPELLSLLCGLRDGWVGKSSLCEPEKALSLDQSAG